MTVYSLWGEIAAVQDSRTPEAILLEQAQALSDLTRNTLVGKVATERVRHTVMHDLLIIAPSLQRYQIAILRLEHSDRRTYPVKLLDFINGDQVVAECKDETELEQELKTTLQSAKVRQIIAALLTQSKDYDTPQNGSQDPA